MAATTPCMAAPETTSWTAAKATTSSMAAAATTFSTAGPATTGCRAVTATTLTFLTEATGKISSTNTWATILLCSATGLRGGDLWFSRAGHDLVVDVLGSEDKVTITIWFSHSRYQIETVSAGGMEIANTQMDQMLQAIASFGVEQGFGGQWTQEQKEQANAAVLGGYWRPVAS